MDSRASRYNQGATRGERGAEDDCLCSFVPPCWGAPALGSGQPPAAKSCASYGAVCTRSPRCHPDHSGSWQKIGTEKLFTRNAAPCGWRGGIFYKKCVSLCRRDEGIAKEEKGSFPSPLLQSPGKRQAGKIRGRLPKAGALRRNLTCRIPESPAVQSAAYIRLCCAPCCTHRRRCRPHNRPMRTGQPVRRPRPTWPTPRIRCRRPG